ncbi:MAG: LppA family lipoprotein [Mycobacteriaceae bacterium]
MTACDDQSLIFSEPEPSLSAEKLQEITDRIRTRPALEVALAERERLMSELAQDITASTPELQWRPSGTSSTNGCDGELRAVGAEYAYGTDLVAAPIPEDAWPRILEIVRQYAQRLGMDQFGGFQNTPGNHDVYYYGGTEGNLRIGSDKAAVLFTQTGCHFSQKKLDKLATAPSIISEEKP